MNPSEFSAQALAWIAVAGTVGSALTGLILVSLKHARDIQAAWDAVHTLQRQVARSNTEVVLSSRPEPPPPPLWPGHGKG